jgi:hypothetical protein
MKLAELSSVLDLRRPDGACNDRDGPNARDVTFFSLVIVVAVAIVPGVRRAVLMRKRETTAP